MVRCRDEGYCDGGEKNCMAVIRDGAVRSKVMRMNSFAQVMRCSLLTWKAQVMNS